MTTAEQIWEQFERNGQMLMDKNDQHVLEVCAARGGIKTVARDGDTRYTFADTSAIVFTRPFCGWELCYGDCFCRLRTGHTDNCSKLPPRAPAHRTIVVDETPHTTHECAVCGRPANWVSGAGQALCTRHQDDY